MASFSDHPTGAAPSFVLARRRRGDAGEALRRLMAPRYLAAGAVAVPLVGFALARFGLGGRFAVAAFVIATLCVLAAIDIAERRLPNRIVLPSAAVVLTAQIALFPDRALEWILATVGASLILLLPLLVYPAGLGMGDVKLALLLGAALGSAVMTALLVASLVAAGWAAFLLLRSGGAARGTAMPFGPSLAIGAVVALLL